MKFYNYEVYKSRLYMKFYKSFNYYFDVPNFKTSCSVNVLL